MWRKKEIINRSPPVAVAGSKQSDQKATRRIDLKVSSCDACMHAFFAGLSIDRSVKSN